MLRFKREPDASRVRRREVRFCDGCSRVSTAEQRARRHVEQVRDHLNGWTWRP
jgi:hypothetical protein